MVVILMLRIRRVTVVSLYASFAKLLEIRSLQLNACPVLIYSKFFFANSKFALRCGANVKEWAVSTLFQLLLIHSKRWWSSQLSCLVMVQTVVPGIAPLSRVPLSPEGIKVYHMSRTLPIVGSHTLNYTSDMFYSFFTLLIMWVYSSFYLFLFCLRLLDYWLKCLSMWVKLLNDQAVISRRQVNSWGLLLHYKV